MNGALANQCVALYARFSSANQRDASIEDQLRRCAAHVGALGGRVDDEMIFSDAAISGSSLARPAFERMMTFVKKGVIKVVVTEDMSRISRDFADSASVLRELEWAGCRLIGVADGIDTAMGGAKLLFGIKSAMNEAYIDDLRFKTRRGLEGRCRAGFSTGGLPFGYRTESAIAADGREIGRQIVVDAIASAIVRRVFGLYCAGYSYDAIAKLLNAEKVPYARLGKKFRRQGWVASSVRAILHNRAYIGEWTWNRREWRKLPGTNVRRPRARKAEDVITQTYPERRIIDPETWDRVRKRASAVSAKYKGKGGALVAPGNRTQYLLGGLLVCGTCGAAMVITRGTSAAYFVCGDHKKRGTCTNSTLLRDDVAQTAIIDAIRKPLFTPTGVTFLRKKIAERLRTRAQRAEADATERLERLRRTEERIHGLVKFIADGDDSKYVRETLRDLEAQARIDTAAIDEAKRELKSPVRLPTPEALVERARDLEKVLAADPVRAREALRGVFDNGRIEMHPTEDGGYVAKATFLPLAAVGEGDLGERTGDSPAAMPFHVTIPKPPDRRKKRP
jgi:DNA invertase Pin-like site-specific DNA recombinase